MASWSSIDDVPQSRRAFEVATTKGTIYFMLGGAMVSGVLAISGLIQLAANRPALDTIPDPIAYFIIGVLGFAFFFPWFTVLYFARHFLSIAKRLERENEEIRQQIRDLRPS